MNIKLLRIISALVLVALMVTIFCFSAQPAEESTDTSDGFITTVLKAFYPRFNTLDSETRQKIVDLFSYPVRKLAHMSIYAALGTAAYFTFISYGKLKFYVRLSISFGVCALYSVSDEIHQYFVPGRACQFTDVIIDCFGAAIAVFMFSIIMRRKFRYE